MSHRLPLGRALGFAAAILLVTTNAQADPPTHETGYIPVAIGTLDETLLHYKVILPDPAIWGPGPYPAVIDYSGYQPAITIFDGLDDRFRDAGYAVVGLNIRGSSCSGGKFDYFEPRQSKDGAEAIEWLAGRPWSDGRLAMVGKSYPGITQLFVAAEQPPHLKAIVPGHVFGDLYRDVPFPGGIMNVTFAAGWSAQRVEEGFLVGPQYYSGVELPAFGTTTDPAASPEVRQQCLVNQLGHVLNPPFNPFVQALYNQYDGPLFHERSPYWFADEIAVPTFLIEAWQDEQVGSRATHLLERLRPGLPWRFLAANGDHGEYYGPEVFPDILRFVSYYVKEEVPAGDPCDDLGSYAASLACYEAEDRVTINWENGAGGGRIAAWRDTYATWPPPEQTVWRLNLHPDGTLSEAGYPPAPPLTRVEILNARQSGAVDYLYVPVVGSEERGGYDLVGEPAASWDRRPPDGTAAFFTTAPLGADRVLLGSASLDLWISSTAPDTDFEVTLSEVRPDGKEMFVQQGWLRASHRREDSLLSNELRPFQTHILTDSSLVLPLQPTKVRIEIFPFGHVFRAGSRLRIAVAAPHVQPDLWGFLELPIPALNTIFASSIYPSSIALPLLAGEAAGAPLSPCTLRNQPCRTE
ncbi:MAG: CocE/NonD family hydrolase [Candidatus Binatia bacterium]